MMPEKKKEKMGQNNIFKISFKMLESRKNRIVGNNFVVVFITKSLL